MNLYSTRLLTAISLAGALAFVAACSGPSSSLSPTGPSATTASSATGGANFSPNPSEPPPPPPPCEPPNEIDPTTGECVPPPPPPPPPPGDEGCTPGYWKNHTDSWPPTGYSPAQTVGSVFAAGAFPSLAGETLLQALQGGGGPGTLGAATILIRAGVAALLNAAHPDMAYTRTAASVIADVNAALASGNRDTMLALASSLDRDNNLGCPLN
ncbi:MAG: hypothetical protein IT177_08955 [Acidobacteria bacterium]|nr:hypothetical protein [Acidobacteriota bacterium]